MFTKLIKYHLFVFSYILGSYYPAFSQGKSEQDLLKQGNKFFYEENYASATPFFLQLLSLNQTSPEYNYKYGTCLLFSDGDKNKPLKYLVFAVSRGGNGLDREAYYYAARALHLNYRFGEAIQYYQKYAGMASDREKEKFQVSRQIEMCNNGKKLLRNVTDLIVVSKKDYREADFFRLYNPNEIEGKILVVEDLQSSADKKKNHRIIVNFPKSSDIVYYSSYGDNGSSLDIYRVKRLPGNQWSKPQLIKGAVNTAYDEDYPYLHPDGRTLYFCSKGHNSMGGYDVFKSTLDPETETFGPPENLDFAINTPDDDILYILDSLEQSAHFASKRESGIGKVHVYNVRVERLPVLIAILKGRFVNEVVPGSNGATITVQDMVSNEAVGIFNAKSSNGDYLITLDRSGKYKYLVKCEGKPEVYEAVVDIPYQRELRPLKQEIALVNKDGKETLVIRNMFDQDIEGADEIIAEVLKNKAALNPNADNIPDSVLQALQKKERDSVVQVSINENLTNEDLIRMAREQAESQQKEAEELKEKMEAAYSVAAQKTSEASEKAREAEKNIAQGDEIIDPLEKGMLYDEAKKLNNEAEKNSKEAVVALNLAKSLEQQYEKAKTDAEVSKKYADGIEKAINSKNKEEAIKQLKEQQAYIQSLMSGNASKEDLYAETKRKAGEKREEASKAMNTANRLKQAESELMSDISAQKREAENAKGKKKEEIQQRVKDLEAELAETQKKKQDAFARADALNREADQLDGQADMLAGILENPDVNPTRILTQAEKEQLAGNIQSESRNIQGNNDKIEQKTQTDRQKKFDYNDFLAKYDYYANMFNEYERLKRNLLTPEDYDRLIDHNEKWIVDINNDLARVEKEEKNASEEQKKQLAAKREELKQLKQMKEQENKDLLVEKQKLLDRLANKNNTANTNARLMALDNPELKEAAQRNEDKIKEIDNSNKTEVRKATEKNKANQTLLNEIDQQIASEKKILESGNNSEKDQARNRLEVLEAAKKNKEKEINDNNAIIARENNNPQLAETTVSDLVNQNTSLKENTEVNNQARKTNTLKEEIGELTAQRSETNDQAQKNVLDKKIKEKSTELYKEEEKLAGTIKTENDKNYLREKIVTENKLKYTNVPEAIRNQAEQLVTEAEKDNQEASTLYTQAQNENDPARKNVLLKQAVEKQNQAIEKQNRAQDILNSAQDNTQVANNTLSPEQEKQLVSSIDNNFETKEKNILSSGQTESEKAKALKTLNEDLVSRINNEIGQLQSGNTSNLSEAEKKERNQRIETLSQLATAKQKEIEKLDQQLQTLAANNNNTNNNPNNNTTNNNNTANTDISYDANPTNYNNTYSQEQYATIKNQVEEIRANKQALENLRNQLKNSTSENEKQNLQNQVDQKERELVKQELEISPVFERIHAAEIKQHQEEAGNMTDQLETAQLTQEQKDRLNRARVMLDQANDNVTTANQLRGQAKNETDENKKNNLLKKAHQLEVDAMRDQQEAQKMLTVLLNEYKETLAANNNTDNPPVNEQDRQLISEVNADYYQRLNEIRNSDRSDTRKLYEENELNKQLVNQLENEMAAIQATDDDNLTEEEKRRRKMKISELNRLLDDRKKALGITEQQLRANNIITDNTQNSQDYSTTLLVNDKNARAEKEKITNQLLAIDKDRTQLAENRLKQTETSDENEKEKLRKESEAIENRLNQKETAIAPAIDRINAIEYKARQNELAQKQLKLAENNISPDAETAQQVEALVTQAENLNREADQLRDQANKEKNATEKNNLLKQAHEKETEAIRQLMKAGQLVDQVRLEQDAAGNGNKTDNERILLSVDQNYPNELREIETSNESVLRKTQQKEKLNETLVNNIRGEISRLEEDLSEQTPEEQQRRKMRLAELNRLLDQKEKELKAQKQLLASNGAGNQDISYTDPYNVNNASARSLQLEAKQRIDELKREEAKLEDIRIKLAEATTTADQAKYRNEARNQEKVVTEKELNVAKVFSDINQLEIKDQKAKLQALRTRIIGSNNIDKNSERVVAAENKSAEADKKLAEAAALRNQAARETDKNKKNILLKQAFALEKEALRLQREAEGMYEILLGEVEIQTARNANDPGRQINGSNTNVAENPEARPSYRELKKYEALNQRADYLEQRYQAVSDSAKTVKKKYRDEVLAMADRLKKESEATRTEANLARNNYENLKQQEDEQLAQQEKRKAETELAQQLAPEVVKMNEYAQYYTLQKDANELKEQINRNTNTENNLRDRANAENAEALNLAQDAERVNDAERKAAIQNRAEQLRQSAARNQARADSVAAVNRDLQAQYTAKQKRADDYLAGIDAEKADKIRKVVGENKTNLVSPEVTYANSNNTVSDPVNFARNFKAPAEVTNDIYVKSNVPAYNNENPIPINTTAPKGVYFKVQVGAFRNPIPQDLFKEFVPVTGETTNTGITRYTVGYFTQFNTANAAKNEIRGFGEQYKDAFVVGFKDGKRIPVAEALRLLNEQPALANNTNNNNTTNNNTINNNPDNTNNANNTNNATNNTNNTNTNNTNNNTNNTNPTAVNNTPNIDINKAGNAYNNFVPDNNAASYYSGNPTAARANQVETIKGLFYTVQVGVYSKPVSLDKIYNIQPLNSELTKTQKIRYTTGIYTEIESATTRKNQARELGIRDAFVTAYFNGQRITMEEARLLREKYGNDIMANPNDPKAGNGRTVNADNNTGNNNTGNNNRDNTPPANNTTGNNTNNNTNTPPANNNTGAYTVILGEYAGDVPSKDAEILLKNNANYPIMKTNRNGKAVFYVEAPRGKSEAEQISQYFQQQGLNNTSITEGVLKGETAGLNAQPLEPKKQAGLKFQVYLGEYIDEVPEDDALIYLSNVDKGVKRKTNAEGYTIYYTCDCESYDDALKLKAHFVQEGITAIRIVPFMNEREISMGEAFKLIYE